MGEQRREFSVIYFTLFYLLRCTFFCLLRVFVRCSQSMFPTHSLSCLLFISTFLFAFSGRHLALRFTRTLFPDAFGIPTRPVHARATGILHAVAFVVRSAISHQSSSGPSETVSVTNRSMDLSKFSDPPYPSSQISQSQSQS